ncbi:hypothetical protein K458DRAFT_424940 [Lentithecium fluviatile CBS 122367]|uniref:Uncharacterized protein n=1 Tax=Lentithecium fluviatile CBS 122367 TaxID=1168545 RepID=A0A6G1IDM1_9PLEO|nr:hypothetical protein K458DRAFT_424940 [Lentithecium fluviatile CBS 122367]
MVRKGGVARTVQDATAGAPTPSGRLPVCIVDPLVLTLRLANAASQRADDGDMLMDPGSLSAL